MTAADRRFEAAWGEQSEELPEDYFAAEEDGLNPPCSAAEESDDEPPRQEYPSTEYQSA